MKNEDVYASCLAFIGVILLIPFMVVFNGIALSYMWEWFIVPKFGLPALNLAETMLLASIITFTTANLQTTNSEDTRSSNKKLTDSLVYLFMALTRPFLALGVFYIILQFV